MKKTKKILIFLLSLILLFTLAACRKENNVNQSMQQVTKEEGTLKENKNNDIEYLKKEVLTEVQFIGSNGKAYTIETYDYDQWGNLIKSWDSRNDDFLEEIVNYEYNDKNQLIKKIVKTADGCIQTEKYEYDKAGNIIREVDSRKQDGEFLAKFEQKMEYDSKNNLLELKLLRDDKLIHTEEYAYDEYGNKILEKKQGEDALSGQKYSEWNEWKYDARGNLLKKLIKDENGVITYGEKYKYNEDGKLKEKTYLKENGEVKNIYTRFYDEEGVLRRANSKDSSDNLLYECNFKYDKNMNRIYYSKKRQNC